MAAALGREQQFDAIWRWTKRNVTRPDALLAFRWADGRIQDPQAAADADLDTVQGPIARAGSIARSSKDSSAHRARCSGHETADAVGQPRADRWTVGGGGRALDHQPELGNDPVIASRRWRNCRATRATRLWPQRDDGSSARCPPLPPDWAVVDAASGRARLPASASMRAAKVDSRGRRLHCSGLAVDPRPLAGGSRREPGPHSPTGARMRSRWSTISTAAAAHRATFVTLVAAAGAATASSRVRRAQQPLAAAEALDREQPSCTTAPPGWRSAGYS